MTEQDFRTSLRRSLSGADLPDCRKERILAITKGDPPVKMNHKVRLALALMALLLALTATVAVASELLFQSSVNWDGQPKDDAAIVIFTATTDNATPALTVPAATLPPPDVTIPSGNVTIPQPESEAPASAIVSGSVSATPQPTMNQVSDGLTLGLLLNTLVEDYPGELLVAASPDNDSTSSLVGARAAIAGTETLATLAELEDRLTGSALPLPAQLPEGYAISQIRVTWACEADGTYDLIATENHGSFTVSRYRPDPDHRFIQAYQLTLTGPAGESCTIRASLTQNVKEMGFGLWNDQKSHAVTVPGMARALMITGADGSELFMMRYLEQTIAYINNLHPVNGALHDRIDTYTDMLIEVEASALEGDALLNIFAE